VLRHAFSQTTAFLLQLLQHPLTGSQCPGIWRYHPIKMGLLQPLPILVPIFEHFAESHICEARNGHNHGERCWMGHGKE
jgi:hypothetical protein